MECRNCNTCKNDSVLNGCVLREKGCVCVNKNFMYYEKDETKKLLKCERCGNFSVREYVGGQMYIPFNPHISFWCSVCDDYPMIHNKSLSQKELSLQGKNYWTKKLEENHRFVVKKYKS